MNESKNPKITFGIIVLNGEPFIRYNLRSIYQFAHEIIIVEGATESSASIATESGHSMDKTIQVLNRFKEEEDEKEIVEIITAEDEGYTNGFWPGEKLEQSQAYAKRATGDWLWQVDIDEFYQPEDVQWIMENLLIRSDVNAISFKQIQFWGGLDWITNGWYLQGGLREIHRIFRWKDGYEYINHRPPTVINNMGCDLSELGHITAKKMESRGIYLYHYSLLFPKNVHLKGEYYSKAKWGHFEKMIDWEKNSYDELNRPYHVHNVYRYPSWLEKYKGKHPPQVYKMWQDILDSNVQSEGYIRRTDDIEALISKPSYRLGRMILKLMGPTLMRLEVMLEKIYMNLPMHIKLQMKKALRSQR
jgi:hypothetical protein